MDGLISAEKCSEHLSTGMTYFVGKGESIDYGSFEDIRNPFIRLAWGKYSSVSHVSHYSENHVLIIPLEML